MRFQLLLSELLIPSTPFSPVLVAILLPLKATLIISSPNVSLIVPATFDIRGTLLIIPSGSSATETVPAPEAAFQILLHLLKTRILNKPI